MEVTVAGTESLGVRGMCCFVKTAERRILLDPGLALGYMRNRQLPHPLQVAVCEKIRTAIIRLWGRATDIVFSHFHGDHVPLVNANPYQLHARNIRALNPDVLFWRKKRSHLSHTEVIREASLSQILETSFHSAENKKNGPLRFSEAVPHGDPQQTDDTVMMTLIQEGRESFSSCPGHSAASRRDHRPDSRRGTLIRFWPGGRRYIFID